jgi:transposase-like protein
MTEKAQTVVIQEGDVHGISNRGVDDLVHAMGGSGVSKSQVSPLCPEIDEGLLAGVLASASRWCRCVVSHRRWR